MILQFLFRLFGCRHTRLTFPQTPRRGVVKPAAAAATGSYVVCLDCGTEIPYSWDGMRLLAVCLLSVIAMAGCARKPAHQVHVAHVPYRAHFDPAHCRYLPDGIRFRCKDVTFDPQEIDATGRK